MDLSNKLDYCYVDLSYYIYVMSIYSTTMDLMMDGLIIGVNHMKNSPSFD